MAASNPYGKAYALTDLHHSALELPARTWRLAIWAFVINTALMIVKILVGWLGTSYALIADGIESGSDILTSLITWIGLCLSLRPPDEKHPFGHGKIESFAGLFSGMTLLSAAIFIGYHAVQEIFTPQHGPAWYTLPVLFVVIGVKYWLSRQILRAGNDLESQALKGDAWHHYSDALTSAAAAIGISIALIGGEGFESADAWGALAACAVIVFNAIRVTSASLHEMMDGNVSESILNDIIHVAREVAGVSGIEKCRVRKSGIGLFVELHVCVDPQMTVLCGHQVGHTVKDTLMRQSSLRILDVVVHLEPYGELISEK